ncbi:MAG: mannosyltransferase family protein [Chloroflexota bacterium]
MRHHEPLSLWRQWDTVWFLGIAQHGYGWTFDGKPALAFFPLYPLLIHLVGSLMDPLVAGLLIANCAFLGALIYLYRLVALPPDVLGPQAEICNEDDGGARISPTMAEPRAKVTFGGAPAGGPRSMISNSLANRSRTAQVAVLILALLPTSLFTAAPYSESLFLLAACGALFHARTRQALPAGVWLAAAVLTRSTGLVLILPVLLLARPRRLRDLCSLLLPAVVSWSVYLLYLRVHHLPLILLLHAQRAWHRQLSLPWVGFVDSFRWVVRHGVAHPAWAVEDVLQLGCALIGLAVTVAAWRELSGAYRAYCVVFWLLVLLTPAVLDDAYAPFGSVDRFLITLVPAVIWLATKSSGRGFRPLLALSSLLLAGATGVQLAGGWVG